MNSRAYVSTIVHAWSDLADRYLLIGINGEQRRPDSEREAPAYNYTYVNYAGRSTYKGCPGTDRESPALVAEVIGEIREDIAISALVLLVLANSFPFMALEAQGLEKVMTLPRRSLLPGARGRFDCSEPPPSRGRGSERSGGGRRSR